jgi:hypothetical protein
MSLCPVSYQKATKWSERRDAVAELTKLASTKKIAPGDFNEVSRTLKKVNIGLNYLIIHRNLPLFTLILLIGTVCGLF